jgi:aspartate beta-hydroxylase
VNQPRPGQPADAAWQIQTLADSARLLAERGELQEAERVYRQILESAPYHIRALNFLAVQALGRGELDQSQHYLEQALRAAPDRAVLHQNLGVVKKEQGKLEEALLSLDRAIALKPDHQGASLHKGVVLEAMGRLDEAVIAYGHAWRYIPDPESVANDQFSAPSLRALIKQAAETLRQAQARVIAETMAGVMERHGAEALKRVMDAAEIYVGRRPAQYAHGLQRPAFIYMPGIEPRSFYERGQFAWVPGLEAASSEIREELRSVLAADQGIVPYVQVEAGVDPQQWAELNGSRAWSAMHLFKAGTPVQANRERCPKTTQAVEALPMPQVPGHAPEALFSILRAGAHIPSHFGLANYKLVVHLPLIVPPGCSIRVGNETRGWTEGECLILDDSFQHEAWNKSDKDRVVLIAEIWHPEVTAAERDGITALVEGTAAFNLKYKRAG